MKNKKVSLENVNLLVVDNKLNEFINKKGISATEGKCRLVQLVLRHKVHHFPTDIPFVAAVKNCVDGQVAVFNVKRTKLALIPGNAVAAETTVGKTFEISGVKYTLTDTVAGFGRYKPRNKRSERGSKASKAIVMPEEEMFLNAHDL